MRGQLLTSHRAAEKRRNKNAVNCAETSQKCAIHRTFLDEINNWRPLAISRTDQGPVTGGADSRNSHTRVETVNGLYPIYTAHCASLTPDTGARDTAHSSHRWVSSDERTTERRIISLNQTIPLMPRPRVAFFCSDPRRIESAEFIYRPHLRKECQFVSGVNRPSGKLDLGMLKTIVKSGKILHHTWSLCYSCCDLPSASTVQCPTLCCDVWVKSRQEESPQATGMKPCGSSSQTQAKVCLAGFAKSSDISEHVNQTNNRNLLRFSFQT